MPNMKNSIGVYVPAKDPDSVNVSSLYAEGELGQAYAHNDRSYQIVKLDSGVAAGVGPGVCAANQVAFWKDRSAYLITNNNNQAEGGLAGSANQAAGIIRNAVTSGYYTHILQRGRNIAVADDGSCNPNEIAVADVTTNVARAVGTAVATAAPYLPLGIVRTASSANVAYVDVDIPNIP